LWEIRYKVRRNGPDDLGGINVGLDLELKLLNPCVMKRVRKT